MPGPGVQRGFGAPQGGGRQAIEPRGPEGRPEVRGFAGGQPGPAVRGPDYRAPGYRAGPGPERFRGPEPNYRAGFYLRERGWTAPSARFRGPVYRYPPGWGYSHWAFGAFLPGVFLISDYTLWQYWVYGLPAPPPGYHWIRVGPDALLVRYGDGYVLDAVYGLFY
jgi:Ni/Co efflux regulator RcnB